MASQKSVWIQKSIVLEDSEHARMDFYEFEICSHSLLSAVFDYCYIVHGQHGAALTIISYIAATISK